LIRKKCNAERIDFKEEDFQEIFKEFPIHVEILREIGSCLRLSASGTNLRLPKYILSCDL
jgi:hypothetical protein